MHFLFLKETYKSSVNTFFKKCLPYVSKLEEKMMHEKTVCTNATNVTVNGLSAYIRNTSVYANLI